MKNKYTFAILSLFVVSVLGIGMASAFGFGNGFMKQDLTDEERLVLEDERNLMKTAIENSDYEAWKSLMEEQISKMQESLSEENFEKIVEGHSEGFGFREMNGEGRMNSNSRNKGMRMNSQNSGCMALE